MQIFLLPNMTKKPNEKIFHMISIIDGRVIDGTVKFSPAPLPGVLTELARFEAERMLLHSVEQDITAGRL